MAGVIRCRNATSIDARRLGNCVRRSHRPKRRTVALLASVSTYDDTWEQWDSAAQETKVRGSMSQGISRLDSMSRPGRVPSISWDNIAEETAAISDTGLELLNAYWITGPNDYPSGDQGWRWRLQMSSLMLAGKECRARGPRSWPFLGACQAARLLGRPGCRREPGDQAEHPLGVGSACGVGGSGSPADVGYPLCYSEHAWLGI
jgi:hypothetical protein